MVRRWWLGAGGKASTLFIEFSCIFDILGRLGHERLLRIAKNGQPKERTENYQKQIKIIKIIFAWEPEHDHKISFLGTQKLTKKLSPQQSNVWGRVSDFCVQTALGSTFGPGSSHFSTFFHDEVFRRFLDSFFQKKTWKMQNAERAQSTAPVNEFKGFAGCKGC